MPIEERDVIFEVRRAQLDRLYALNEFLIDVFVRTRLKPLEEVVIDLDPTDDPAHGQQQLTFWHAYYDQNQYFPMLLFEGQTGMPLGAWLRPGKAHASWGAADMLRRIVERLRQHWPEVAIRVRGDNGVACPEMYDYCEAAGLKYAFGYANNEVLKRKASEDQLLDNARWLWWMSGRESFQLFHEFNDYQAESWSHPRRMIVKVEITRQGGPNVRHVITNMTDRAADLYHGFYTKRGRIPEQPIGELKNGLFLDRLSSHRFLANAQKMMTHVLAYLLYALFREANAQTPELKTMEVGTARTRLFKVGASVEATHRRIWFRIASHWPGQSLLAAAIQAVQTHVEKLHSCWRELNQLFQSQSPDRHRIVFAPLPPK